MDLQKKALKVLDSFKWVSPLLTRLSLGMLFMGTGWGKLHHIEKVVDFFTRLQIPAPEFHARLVGISEFGCGLLLVLGFLTRFATLPLVITMVVALITAKKEDINELYDLFGLSEYLYILLFVWLGLYGPGKVSLDALVAQALTDRKEKRT